MVSVASKQSFISCPLHSNRSADVSKHCIFGRTVVFKQKFYLVSLFCCCEFVFV